MGNDKVKEERRRKRKGWKKNSSFHLVQVEQH
jgi:hypothetical protein